MDSASVIFVQTFGSGSLFRTQGSGADLAPYTLYLWDTGDHTMFFTDQPVRAAGLLMMDRFLQMLTDTTSSESIAALVAPSEEGSDVAGVAEAVWVLKLEFGGRGSDPGSLTYQGELVAADETAARFGVVPAPEPDGVQNVGGGFLFVTGMTGIRLDDGSGVLLRFP